MSLLPRERIAEFLQRLYSASINGKVTWSRVDKLDDIEEPPTYQVPLGRNFVNLSRSWNVDAGAYDYDVVILSPEKFQIWATNDTSLSDYWDSAYEKLRELYELAQASAAGLGAALDDMLEAIEDAEEIPF